MKEEKDRFVCIEGELFEFHKLVYKKARKLTIELYKPSKNKCKKFTICHMCDQT